MNPSDAERPTPNHDHDHGSPDMNDDRNAPTTADTGDTAHAADGSAPSTDPLASMLRGAFEDRAALAEPSADAWNLIDARRGTIPVGRGRVLGLSMLAAAAAIVVILGVVVVSRSDDTSLVTGDPAGSSTTATTATPATSTTTSTPPTSDPEVAPGTTEAPAAIAPDIANATLPSSLCASDARPPTPEFTMVGGAWGAGWGNEDFDVTKPIGVRLASSRQYDFTGDGVDDTLIWLDCFISHSSYLASTIAVIDQVEGKAVVIASRQGSGTNPMGEFTSVVDDVSRPITEQRPLEERVLEVTHRDDDIVVTWHQFVMGGDDAAESYRAVVTYRLNGDRLDVVGAPVRTATPRPSGVLSPKERFAIRTVDLRSVTVPLALGERDPSQFVCHDFFGAPPEEVVDAKLVNGTANVTNTAGQPLLDPATGLPRGATVTIDQIFYGVFAGTSDFDYESPEQAMVVIRCGTDVEAYRVPVVFHLVNGQPQVLEVISNPPETKSALEVSIDRSRPEQRLKIVWGFDPSFHPDQPYTVTTWLRWDGSQFEVTASA